MKDLYGLRNEDIDMLKQAGYGDDIFYVGNYGILSKWVAEML